jgi:hypothetical protein
VEADAGGKQKMVNTALKPGETELAGNCNKFTKMHTLFDIHPTKVESGFVCVLIECSHSVGGGRIALISFLMEISL